MNFRFLISDFRLPESQICGMTLIELLTVVAIVAVVMLSLAPHITTGRQAWEIVGDRHAEVMQNSRMGLDKMTREIRQAQSITDAGSDYIEFVNRDDNDMRFEYDDAAGEYLEYGSPGGLDPLSGPIGSLSMVYYEEDGVTSTTTPENIRSVQIQMTTLDSEGKVSDITLSSRVFIRKDAVAGMIIVINEILYSPTSNPERVLEWIELYNNSDADVDIAGWELHDNVQTDDILGDSVNGTGSTVIPAGGYAIITGENTEVYEPGSPYSVDADAVRLQVGDNKLGSGLDNNGDILTILSDSGEVMDSVSYDDSWGGDGNDHSLERIDPQGGSNDPANWKEGPLYGTPGSENS